MSFFNAEIESLPLIQMRLLQNERLKALVERVYNSIPFYKKMFDEAKLKPSDIQTVDDLYKIPFTYKTALRDNYPFGLFAVPRSQLSRLHCSSGTTGKPIVVGYTAKDIDLFAEVVARSLYAGGCRPGMLLQNAYGYGLFTGGLGLHYGAEKLGMTVLPISGGGTDKQLMLMHDFGSDVICCTPSYALTLAESVKKLGMSPNDVPFKYAVLGAEPWTESVRIDIEKGLGVHATNIYGLSEIIGPGVSQEDVDEKGTGSYIWEDHFYPEVVDKDTGIPLPYGEQGVLVFTTLTKEASPVLRYWTNDITTIYYDRAAKRSHIKMGPILGRSDDMLIIRGVNLFHTQVEAVLEHSTNLSTNYQLIVTTDKAMDTVEVKVELTPPVYDYIIKEGLDIQQHELTISATKELQTAIKNSIGLSMKVTVVVPETIARSEGGKLNRIIDLRKK